MVGYGRSRANLETAQALGILDRIAETPEAAVADADAVLLAMPVGAMQETFARIAAHVAPEAVLTDAGSTKADVIAAARAGLGSICARFVPAHPIAGAEMSGASAAVADLYQGKPVILTPLPENTAATVARVRELWLACGAQVLEMRADRHDQVFAAVSHLPHLAAFALVDELASRPEAALYFRHAGSGFRDFTRIAASSPEMWRDIALANRTALLAELDAYLLALQGLRANLTTANGEALLASFSRARAARAGWTPHSHCNED